MDERGLELLFHWAPVFLNIIVVPVLIYLVKIEKRLIKLETFLGMMTKNLKFEISPKEDGEE